MSPRLVSRQWDMEPLAEYGVYSAILRKWWWETHRGKPLVLLARTSIDPSLHPNPDPRVTAYLAANFPELPSHLLERFLALNSRQVRLKDTFELPVRVAFISADMEKAFFREDVGEGWERFYRHYPRAHGMHTLSRVALDPDSGYALVYMDCRLGGLNAYGWLMLLERIDRGWKVSKSVLVWIS